MTSHIFSYLLKGFTDTTPAFSVCSDTVNKWELMAALAIVPGDPALIRSDNTVRNGISTIGLQSLSSQSKGLLKHSAAQHCSLSFSPSFFPVSLCHCHFLYLSVFLPLSIPSDSPHPCFVAEKGEHEYHTQTASRPLHRNITAARFFSISSESLFSLSTGNSSQTVLFSQSFYL